MSCPLRASEGVGIGKGVLAGNSVPGILNVSGDSLGIFGRRQLGQDKERRVNS